jgi:hypothetical protein
MPPSLDIPVGLMQVLSGIVMLGVGYGFIGKGKHLELVKSGKMTEAQMNTKLKFCRWGGVVIIVCGGGVILFHCFGG